MSLQGSLWNLGWSNVVEVKWARCVASFTRSISKENHLRVSSVVIQFGFYWQEKPYHFPHLFPVNLFRFGAPNFCVSPPSLSNSNSEVGEEEEKKLESAHWAPIGIQCRVIFCNTAITKLKKSTFDSNKMHERMKVRHKISRTLLSVDVFTQANLISL